MMLVQCVQAHDQRENQGYNQRYNHGENQGENQGDNQGGRIVRSARQRPGSTIDLLQFGEGNAIGNVVSRVEWGDCRKKLSVGR